ncbi:auxin-responsive protein IAA13 isoform X1 [Cryptomeria japonica]|uniref:auxin-responsive protein IAA13 isoform X1 n=2 Tax=Cryptomeria japonica TaxID=3369 RepID=UPI0025AC73F0|nr:auxin-responsive protein IAA13 isoform X1 [Cryptomeria japonica]
MLSGVGSSRSNGSNVTVSTLSQANTGLTEHDYIGLSEVSSSSSDYVQEQGNVESLEEAELNLGLSLSYKKANNSNTNAAMTGKGFVCENEYQRSSSDNPGEFYRGGFKQWVTPKERVWPGARILTAQDLQALTPSMGEAATPGYAAFPDSNKPIVTPAGSKRASNESPSASPREQAVGWPPVGSFRRSKLPTQPRPTGDDQEECVQQPSKSFPNQGSSLYVKVNMDGVPIGRKVDLNAHDGYESLALALEDMFQRPTNGKIQNSGQIPMQKARTVTNEHKRPRFLDSSSDFVLTYEDKEGDWMLVGDVPWRMFVNTIKRLRIMKTSDANGLGPRCSEKINRQKSKPI